jgi:hypothetical protein
MPLSRSRESGGNGRRFRGGGRGRTWANVPLRGGLRRAARGSRACRAGPPRRSRGAGRPAHPRHRTTDLEHRRGRRAAARRAGAHALAGWHASRARRVGDPDPRGPGGARHRGDRAEQEAVEDHGEGARSRSLSLSSRPSHPDGVAWTSSAASDEPAQAEKEPPCADLSPPPSGTSQERPTTSRALLCASQASTSDTLRLPCVPEVPGGAAHSSGCAAQRSTCVPPTPTCVPFGATGEGSPFDLRAFRSNDCAASTASRAARA